MSKCRDCGKESLAWICQPCWRAGVDRLMELGLSTWGKIESPRILYSPPDDPSVFPEITIAGKMTFEELADWGEAPVVGFLPTPKEQDAAIKEALEIINE